MKLLKKLTVLMVPVMALALTACGNEQDSSAGVGDEKVDNAATLFITVDNEFKEYELEYDGDLTAEALIQGIADKTGWNLDLADIVTSGKGGMTVTFADTAAVGTLMPPEPQVEEFFVYDGYGLVEGILDSVTETLQNNFVDPELGEPDLLDIYFNVNEKDIVVYDVTVPMDEPWSGDFVTE